MTDGVTRAEFLGGGLAAAALATLPGQTAAQAAASALPNASRPRLRNRQVHLDFHTSELITGIGERFDRKQFQAALKLGKVDQVNVFAKCHMSWSYYPTKIGRVHPHLKFDLLGEQLAACREIGVRAPIYFTVGWSAQDAKNHPEWCARDKAGAIQSQGPWSENPEAPKPTYNWKFLCMAASGPYSPWVLSHIDELCRMYPVDGFWLDIYHLGNQGCYCAPCKRRMAGEGIDLRDHDAVTRSTARSIKQHMSQVRSLVAKHHPGATVFFNPSPHVGNLAMFRERNFDENTQQEIEDLPTTWGGYDKLPIESKFHLGDGSRGVAMSGKFHKSWGEFGGFKSPGAIRYEAAAMISYGVSCNFGDQLHPSGVMDPATYRNIGEAYSYVERIEDYGPGGAPYSKLGLWLSLDENSDRGASGMLLEAHCDYVIATARNLRTLSTVVIPSTPNLTAQEADMLNGWAKRGGRLVVLGAGGMDGARSRFLLEVGAEYVGKPRFDCDYTVVDPVLGRGLVETPFLNYAPAIRTRLAGGRALARLREPYFSRTNAHYSGHANTPYRLEDAAHPAVVRHGNVIFFAHDLDKMYLANGMKLHRDMFRNAIEALGSDQAMRIEGLPSAGRVSLLHQADKNRYVAHLLYSPALLRGDAQVIEDFPVIGDVRLTMNLPSPVRSVTTAPGGQTLKIRRDGSATVVEVPPFAMHTAVVFNV